MACYDVNKLLKSSERFNKLAEPESAGIRAIVQSWAFEGRSDLDLRDRYSDSEDIVALLSSYNTAYETFMAHLPKTRTCGS